MTVQRSLLLPTLREAFGGAISAFIGGYEVSADSRLLSEQSVDLWATYTYDNDGRVLTEEGPLVSGGSYSYDSAGNVTAETDSTGEVTTMLYDAMNRVTVQQQPLGQTVTTTYDLAGNVLSVEDGDDNMTTYAYDPNNEKTSSTDPLGHHTEWAYDPLGRVTSTTDADGRTIRTSFDADNNVTSETWLASDGTTVQDTQTYRYDADNNQTYAGDSAGVYTMSYDNDDRLTFVQEPFGVSVSYAYDGAGDVTLQQDSFGGVITSTYDADGDLWGHQFSQGGSVPEQLGFEIDYTADGMPTQIRRYADAAETDEINVEAFDYSAGRVTAGGSYDVVGGAVLATTDSYGYKSDGGADDGAAQMTSLTDYGESTTTYMYDAAGQLTGSQDNLYGNRVYSYDAAGNSTVVDTTIGTDNQISTDGTWNYFYDADGNRIEKVNIADSDCWTYAYDDANRLITVEHHSSSSGGVPTGTLLLEETYTYDVFGNRLSDTLTQSGSTTVTRFAYDQYGNAWADLNSSNQLVTRRIYLNGVDQLFARIDAATGDAFYYMTDAQGSVRAILDVATDSIVDRIDYDAWGNVLNETNPSYGDRYKYTGREFDSATGLQYNRGRYYDPVTRTWISQDPLGFGGGQSNLYEYVDNDPMDGTDPSGTQEKPTDPSSASFRLLSQAAEARAAYRDFLSSKGATEGQMWAAGAVQLLLSQNAQPQKASSVPSMRATTPQDLQRWARNRQLQNELEASERSAAAFQKSLSAMNPTYSPDWDMIERVRQRQVVQDAQDWAKLSLGQQLFNSVLEQAIWGLAFAGLSEFAALTKIGQGVSSAEMAQFVKSHPQAVENGLVDAYQAQSGKILSSSERAQLKAALQDSLPKVEASLGTNNGPYVTFNETHAGAQPVPRGIGPNGGRLQSHHGLQQEWAAQNLPGYDPKLAPNVFSPSNA